MQRVKTLLIHDNVWNRLCDCDDFDVALLGARKEVATLTVVGLAVPASLGRNVWFPWGIDVCAIFNPTAAFKLDTACTGCLRGHDPAVVRRDSGTLVATLGSRAVAVVRDSEPPSIPISRVVCPLQVAMHQDRPGGPITVSSLEADDLQGPCCYLRSGSASEPLATTRAGELPAALFPFVQSAAQPPARPGPPVLRHAPHTAPTVRLALLFETLFTSDATAPHAQAVLHATVRQRIAETLATLQHFVVASAALPPAAAVCHFLPSSQAVPVSVLCPLDVERCGIEDEAAPAIKAWRRNLHSNTLTSPARPAFRAALRLRRGPVEQPRLMSIHEQCAPPPLADADTAVVAGRYAFHHYGQDGVDDRGWGCAYRSLQTLWSWFQEAGYTAEPAPTHREMQAALVELGDKPAALIGSSEWLGAVELGLILQARLNIEHKLLSVPSGNEMGTLAGRLVAHFRSEGTPVMIGGGVLAYTCLGAQWDAHSEDAAFLILDPHYRGPDVEERALDGGWVAWRRPGDQAAAGGALFRPDAFYNVLCPLRPRDV